MRLNLEIFVFFLFRVLALEVLLRLLFHESVLLVSRQGLMRGTLFAGQQSLVGLIVFIGKLTDVVYDFFSFATFVLQLASTVKRLLLVDSF